MSKHPKDQDLKEFRSKTISRIIDNKREQTFKRLNEEEERKRERNAFRIRYKEELKKKRSQEVVDKVDATIIKSIGKQNGVITSELFQQKQENLKQLEMYLSNLDEDDHDNLGDNSLLSAHGLLMDDSNSRKSNKESLADSSSAYLQKAAAFGLHPKENSILSRMNSSKQGSKLDLIIKHPGFHQETLPEQNLFVSEAVQDLLRVDRLKTDSFKSRKPRGLMLKLMQEAGIPLSIASTDGSYGSSNSPLKQQSSVGQANSNAESAFATFVDCCYLVGPDKDSISALSKSFSLSSSANEMASVVTDRSPEKMNKANNDKIHRLEPKVLFRSDNEFPTEMVMLLPSYCFPSGAEVTLDTKPSLLTKRNNSIGKSNLSMVDNKKNKKKIRIFFPSENSIKIDEGKIGSADGSDMLTNSAIISTYQKSVFVLLLGDHTYQRYCFGVNFPVVFWNAADSVLVETTYTLCFMTQFPFISYLTYMVNQLEEETNLFSFPNALSVFDPAAPIGSELRNLFDLSAKLRKITVPLFPALSKNNPTKMENKEPSEKIVATRSEYISYLPDVVVDVAMKASLRKPVIFKRKYYATFYSDLLINSDEMFNTEESSWNKLLEKMKSNFILSQLHRLEKEKEDAFFMLQWSLPVLIKYLPLDQIILAIGCIITEMKIIVKHDDLHIVSSIVFALIYLLKPLKWCSPVIVSLPESLNDFIDSPVPIILGLQNLPKGYLLPERCVVIDPAERIVHLNPIDIVQSQTILLPNASKLVNSLKGPFEAITKLSKKKGQKSKPINISPMCADKITLKVDPTLSPIQSLGKLHVEIPSPSSIDTTVHEDTKIALDSCSTAPLSKFNSNKDPVSMPPPIELDIENSNCFALMSAIRQFSTAVYNHIQVVLNTALQMQHKEKEEARAKRRKLLNGTLKKSKDAANNKPVGSTDWQPVQISNIPRGNESQRNREVDDTVSEVTFTDLPSEGGNSDDMEKESVAPEQSSGASISSSASSLPSLQSDAPKLLNKDIGQHGLKFFTKLKETQMYSNYCQYLKVNRQIDSADISSDTSVKGLDINLALLDDLEEPESNDSIALLFEILLTGSIGLDSKFLNECTTTYNKLYKPDPKVDNQSFLKSLPVSKTIPKVASDRNALQNYTEEVLMKYVTEKRAKVPLQIDNLRYCNGLLCNGFSNTEICSEICVSLWACQVQLLRREHMKYEVLSKRYDKHAKSELSVDEVGNQPQIKYISKKGAKFETVRHPKETESQFLKRSEIVNQLLPVNRSNSPTLQANRGLPRRHRPITAVSLQITSKSVPASSPNRPSVSNQSFVSQEITSKALRKRCFAKSNDPYVRKLAKYYAKKEEKSVKIYMKRCFQRIQRFVLQYIWYYRKMKFLHYVKFSQAMLRGKLVRRKRFLNQLKAGKLLRWAVTIRFRNYVRNHSNEILSCLRSRQQREKQKRHSLISIPVAAADIIQAEKEKAKLNAFNGFSRKSITQPSTAEIHSLKFIAEPELKTESFPDHHRPSLPKAHSSPSIDPVLSNNSPRLPPGDHHNQYPNNKRTSFYAEKAREFLQFGKILNRNSIATTKPPSAKPMYIPKPLPKKSPANSDEPNLPAPPQSMPVASYSSTASLRSPSPPLSPSMVNEPTDKTIDRVRADDEKSVLSHLEWSGKAHSETNHPNAIEDINDEIQTLQKSKSNDSFNIQPEDLPNDFPVPVIGLEFHMDEFDNKSIISKPPLSYEGNFGNSVVSPVGSGTGGGNSDNETEISDITSFVGTLDHPPKARRRSLLFGKYASSSSNINQHSSNNQMSTNSAHNISSHLSSTSSSKALVRPPSPSDYSLSEDKELKKVKQVLKPFTNQSNSNLSSEKSQDKIIAENDGKSNSPEVVSSAQEVNSVPITTTAASSMLEKLFEEVKEKETEEDDDDEDDDDDDDDDDSPFNRHDDLSALLNHQPLKSLGPEAREQLNRQQLIIIRNMWLELREGVHVIKHGRHGKPKEKKLFCDVAMTKLYWRDPSSSPGDNDEDEEEIEQKSNYTKRRSSIFGTAGSLASTFRRNADQSRNINLREILTVSADYTTEVMQRSINKGYYVADGNMLISVMDSQRSLDFEIEANLWPIIFHALQVLVDFFQGHLATFHQLLNQDQANQSAKGNFLSSVFR